jgi:hypothetical protein
VLRMWYGKAHEHMDEPQCRESGCPPSSDN